jgi:hypothetical protein
MSGDTTADLEDLIERLRRGEATARGALLERVYHRLRRIRGLHTPTTKTCSGPKRGPSS